MAPKTGANDPPGMWMPGGATGLTRPPPRRVGPAVAKRAIRERKKSATSAARPIGSSAISAPQSGMTNWAVRSRIASQICSIG